MNIKVISFDLDGTLIDKGSFDDLFWFKEVPELYSKHHGLDFESAKEYCVSKYNEVGRDDPNWFRPAYWFERFELPFDHNKIIMDLALGIQIFPEVKPLLKELMKNHQLIVITNNPTDFMKLKMRAEGLDMYFAKMFSTVDDFDSCRKHPKVFLEVAERMGVLPGQIMHIGDDYEFDYLAPKESDLNALYLDRSGNEKKIDTIHSLNEIKNHL